MATKIKEILYSEMYDSKTNFYNKLEFSIGSIRSLNMKNSKQHTTLYCILWNFDLTIIHVDGIHT